MLEDLRKDHPHLPETSVFTIPENQIGSSYNNNIFNTFHESGISFMRLGNDIKRRRVAPQVYTITDIGENNNENTSISKVKVKAKPQIRTALTPLLRNKIIKPGKEKLYF